ncbi:serine hydrolase domain-containing protein [Chitinophaga defluvii]|uniref:Serine hydrolase domain-containing protein n=1 Tax=Chitinophaga defluvii TaxID=3163343 RepID=A0ABV2T883_9BACT
MTMPAIRIYVLCLLCLLTAPLASAQQTAKNLAHLFDSLEARGGFNGCVLVAEEGKPIFSRAIGYANQDKKQLLNIRTDFELASVSKQFTALAIMQLKEKGKLTYDDSLKKYFPALPYKGITLRHLLIHTSGLPEFLAFGKAEVDINRINYNKDILAVLSKAGDTTLFKPGTSFAYCNTNYLLLALIVEKVSGLPFARYMTQYVFNPAGMLRTKVYARRADKEPMDNYALSYIWDARLNKFIAPDSSITNARAFYLDGVAGPYGISSNVEDLLKWDQVLYTNKLVSAATLQEAFTPGKKDDGSALKGIMGYGFGWIALPLNDSAIGASVYHTGGYPGYQSVITRYLDKHKTVILLTNFYEKQNVNELTGIIEDILFGHPYTIPAAKKMPRSVPVTTAQVQGFDGVYAMDQAPAVKMTITTRDSRVFAQLTGQSEYEVYASSADTFFYTVVAARLKFDKDKDGIVQKITLFQNGQEMPMSRIKETTSKL